MALNFDAGLSTGNNLGDADKTPGSERQRRGFDGVVAFI